MLAIGLKRISNIFFSHNPPVSKVSGFGSIGILRTELNDYYAFGVNPDDPLVMIIPDVEAKDIKITKNGGMEWKPIPQLKELVTHN